jgi:type IV pilus assembly protein PilO
MSFKESMESMKDFDINNLEFENIGIWPAPVKAICWALCFVIVIAVGYFYVVSDLEDELVVEQKKEQKLKETFRQRAFEAANLESYRAQMVEIEENFGALLGQLPRDAEIPGLLEDITRVGNSNGLEFEKIDLQQEVPVEFYIRQPIKIVVTGSYHDFGTFVSGVSNLPRIVKLQNFVIEPLNDSGALTMDVLAETYRYKD